ncbi:hypothetical protein [Nonomuraea basaltis]|uniref:hypothetical protein n=1 Tax=Nonomuraea basaltis TaxID=2495887 RepID=UPI00148750EA|nr:hypothetical protein [Nonomuraea basaltis]
MELLSRRNNDGAMSLKLHKEGKATRRWRRRNRPAHLDMCRAVPTEEVEQQLA